MKTVLARDVSSTYSGGLQTERARELLLNINSASLHFHEEPASLVRRAVTSYASQLY